jgi:hypothetical protein
VTTAALTVNYTVGGTATSGTDYTAIPSPVVFAAGSATATKTVTALADAVSEGDETVVVTLAAGTGYAVGSPSSATVTIKDQAAQPCQSWVTAFTPGTLRNNAAGWRGLRLRTWASGPVTVSELGRVYLNGNVQSHEVALFLASTGVKVASVVWTPAGGVHNQIKHLALGAPVVLSANTEYYLASWEVSGGDSWYSSDTVLTTTGVAAVVGAAYNAGAAWATIGSPGNSYVPVSMVTCTEPPPPTVTVAATDALASEPGGVEGTGTFTFTRTGVTTAALTVNYTVGGTATSGTDYTAIPSPVVFAAGSATATKTVSVMDENVAECTEWVDVTLAAGTGYTIGTPSSATATIADDDLPQLSVVATAATTSEPGGGFGPGSFTLTRIGCLSGPLTVSFTVGGTATGGADYTSIGTTAAFDAGLATTTKSVTALADFLVEGDETVVVTLAVGVGYGVGSPASATVTIKDVPPPCQNWVTAFTPGTLRNNAAGWRGLRLRTGATAVSVHELGRVYLNGNVQSHEVALFHATTGAKVGSVIWTPAGGTHNQIQYTALAAPVVLSANTEYYLASWEVPGGDSWYSSDTVVTTSGAATVLGAAYNAGAAWATIGSPGNSYGPVSLVWCSTAGAGADAEWPEPEAPLMELVIHLPDTAEPEYAGAFAIVPGQEYVLEALMPNGDWVAVGALTGQPGVLEVVDVTGLAQGALAYQLVIAPQPETADPDE